MAQIKIRKYNPGGVLTTETGDTFTLEEIEQLVRENPTNENLLFYALNCGNKFIQLHDCIIQSKDGIEFQPEQVKCYNINLDIVHSCQITDED